MPEIITRGTKPPLYPWMGVYGCSHCKSVLRLTEADKDAVEDTNDDQRDGYSVLMRCPVCEQKRWLSKQWQRV